MKTAVLLATYNGEQFLKPQIESLLNQTYNDFDIYISDDISTDFTNEIINEYIKQYPEKIFRLQNNIKFGNARDNFLNLVSRVYADIYLFCDQDDIWNQNKIQKLVQEYEKYPNNIPTLIHSDLAVVDKDLVSINNSLFSMMHLDKKINWKRLLVQNNVTGCTILINKTLADLYRKNANNINNDNIIMHDYFFALLASIFGDIYFIDEPLILYRQHGTNSVGAKKVYSIHYLKNKIHEILNGVNLVQKTQTQASEILKIFPEDMKQNIIYKTIEQYSLLSKKSKLFRLYFLIKNKLLKNSLVRIIYQFISI